MPCAFRILRFLACLSATLTIATVLRAQAPTGIGIAAGFGSSDYQDAAIRDNDGPAIGLDAQLALGDSISVGPIVQYAHEEGELDLGAFGWRDVTITVLSYGLQARGWIGGFFAGGHLAQYDATLDFSGDTASRTGAGYGLVAGWESRGGWSAHAQYDEYSVGSGGDKINVTATHIFLGFRFK